MAPEPSFNSMICRFPLPDVVSPESCKPFLIASSTSATCSLRPRTITPPPLGWASMNGPPLVGSGNIPFKSVTALGKSIPPTEMTLALALFDLVISLMFS